jgi:hypothetical protein
MPSHPRLATDSRCSQPQGAPYMWHDFVNADHPSVVRLDTFLQELPPFSRIVEEGEIEDLHEAAARGELWESADDFQPLVPIVSDPEIYELRHKGLRQYRFYHGEPSKYPALLVKLHRHIKDDAVEQQTEIEYAMGRFRDEG